MYPIEAKITLKMMPFEHIEKDPKLLIGGEKDLNVFRTLVLWMAVESR